jgi:large subunit ribosomal protein L6
MSRIGKQELIIPAGTTVSLDNSTLTVKGAKGENSRNIDQSVVEVKIEEGKLTFTPRRNDKQSKSLWGTYASLTKSMIKGVNTPFEKKLIVEGVGYKWELTGNSLKLALGFSHPVNVDVPSDVTVVIDKLTMTISGLDKEKVGQFARQIRALKEPEPYKGKGIRYSDEVIRRKQGKRSA